MAAKATCGSKAGFADRFADGMTGGGAIAGGGAVADGVAMTGGPWVSSGGMGAAETTSGSRSSCSTSWSKPNGAGG